MTLVSTQSDDIVRNTCFIGFNLNPLIACWMSERFNQKFERTKILIIVSLPSDSGSVNRPRGVVILEPSVVSLILALRNSVPQD